MLSNRYGALHDPVSSDETTFAAAKICMKFCTFGLVTSKKWVAGYITILDGMVRIYDSQESCQSMPSQTILTIPLTSSHRVSEIKIKNYSQDKMKIVEFFCFYIEVDNGIFAPNRLIKIACFTRESCDKLANAVDASTRAV